jgi:hypothetical protein
MFYLYAVATTYSFVLVHQRREQASELDHRSNFNHPLLSNGRSVDTFSDKCSSSCPPPLFGTHTGHSPVTHWKRPSRVAINEMASFGRGAWCSSPVGPVSPGHRRRQHHQRADVSHSTGHALRGNRSRPREALVALPQVEYAVRFSREAIKHGAAEPRCRARRAVRGAQSAHYQRPDERSTNADSST